MPRTNGAEDGIGGAVRWLALGRLPATTATRMLAPLLGVISTGLGLSIVAAGGIVAVFELVGLTAPAAGWLVDRLSARASLVVGLVVFMVGGAVAAVGSAVVVFAAGLVAAGLGANLYEAASVVWLAEHTPFSSRARWMGSYELSWAGGMLAGVPIAALVSLASWRAPFAAVVVACVPALLLMPRRLRIVAPLPAVHPTTPSPHGPTPGDLRPSRAHAWWVFVGFGVLCGASSVVFVVVGVWLEDRFGLGPVAIGVVAFLLGVADLLATRANLRHTDRIGKRRAATFGSIAVGASSVVLALFSGLLVAGVLALFVLIMCFEFAVVSAKPLLTELGWRRQGVGVGIGFASAAGCRSAAALGGAALYEWHGFAAAALATGTVALVAAAVFAFGVREPHAG